jgi:hypothetical protein
VSIISIFITHVTQLPEAEELKIPFITRRAYISIEKGYKLSPQAIPVKGWRINKIEQ